MGDIRLFRDSGDGTPMGEWMRWRTIERGDLICLPRVGDAIHICKEDIVVVVSVIHHVVDFNSDARPPACCEEGTPPHCEIFVRDTRLGDLV